jgi:hypothetical protein
VKARALGNEADLLEAGSEPQGSEAVLLLGSEAMSKEPDLKAEPRRTEANPLGLEADLTKWLHVSLGIKDGFMRQTVVEGEEGDILPIWPRSLNAATGEYCLLLSFYLHISNSSFKSTCLSCDFLSSKIFKDGSLSKVSKMNKSVCSVCKGMLFLNAYCLLSTGKVLNFGLILLNWLIILYFEPENTYRKLPKNI